MVENSVAEETIFQAVDQAILNGTEPSTENDDAGAAEATESSALSQDERSKRWLSHRPKVDHLPVGVTVLDDPENDGEKLYLPLFDVGQRIVVDCQSYWLPNLEWIYTLVGTVRSIDDDTGLVTLFDEESDSRNPMVRYVSFKDGKHDIRLAPVKGSPFAEGLRARLLKEQKDAERNAAILSGEKRGRGRPKGTKNRPKEEVKAEREAYRQAQADKKSRKAR